MMKPMLSRILALLTALLLVLPAALAEAPDTLAQAALALSAVSTADEQLALLDDLALRFADELEWDGWDVELNALLAEALPASFLPTDDASFENAVDASALPDELRGLKLLTLYDDDGEYRLLGDFAARLPQSVRAQSLSESEAVLLLRHTTVARTDYTFSAYDRLYDLYAWKLGSDAMVRLLNRKTTPPFSGYGTLYGTKLQTRAFWMDSRALLLPALRVEDEAGALTYSVTGKSCYLSSVEGDRTELTVPAQVEGYPVVSFAACGLPEACPSLETVTLPQGLLRIEERAFAMCPALREVVLPDTLQSIGNEAFYSCKALRSPVFPASLRLIGDGAYKNCESATVYDLPEGLLSLGDEAILSWRLLSMERVTLPSTLQSVGESFLAGGGVLWLVVPESLTELPFGFLKDSPNTFCVYLPASVETFGGTLLNGEALTIYTPQGSAAQAWAEQNGVACVPCETPDDMPRPALQTEGDFQYVLWKDEAYLARYTGEAAEVVVPAELGGCPVRTILESAFYEQSFLTSITFPDSVTWLQEGAVQNCGRAGGTLELYVPASVTRIDHYAVHMGGSTKIIHAPEGSAAQEWAEKQIAFTRWEAWEP